MTFSAEFAGAFARGRAALRQSLRRMLICAAPLVLLGCMEGNRLSFAPPGEQASRPASMHGRALTAVFGEGRLILAAPSGFCFDAQMEQHTAKGGFALLARCDKVSAFGGFRKSEGALLTATVGRVAENTPPPSAEALRSAFTKARKAARVLETRQTAEMPLLKLYLDDHHAEGASGTHWRGAFVVRGHLVSVALYAPDGSAYLGDQGARLITEFMHATRNATQLAEATTPAAPGEAAPDHTTRPRTREEVSAATLPQGEGG
ncbi:hypothetical protein HCZ87_15475 [Phaeobacter sp. HF9A]|nr:hypothetical protein [Phaeobacter sp. HF9A]